MFAPLHQLVARYVYCDNVSFQALYILPSNFEEVATGVLKVLNNLALLDIVFLQRMLVTFPSSFCWI